MVSWPLCCVGPAHLTLHAHKCIKDESRHAGDSSPVCCECDSQHLAVFVYLRDPCEERANKQK